MELKIEIEVESLLNGGDLADVLRGLAQQFAENPSLPDGPQDGVIRDASGNSVGKWWFEAEA